MNGRRCAGMTDGIRRTERNVGVKCQDFGGKNLRISGRTKWVASEGLKHRMASAFSAALWRLGGPAFMTLRDKCLHL